MTASPALDGSQSPVLAGEQMSKHFSAGRGMRTLAGQRRVVHAVDDASVALAPGEIVAVVGESGSGKTTLGRLMSRLELPTSGSLRLDGRPVRAGGTRALRPFRRRVQVVFQDPYASLNAAHKVGYHLQRPLLLHKIARSGADARTMAIELLERVGLRPGSQFM